MIYPLSRSMPAINTMYTNADQFTAMKKSGLLEFAGRKIPRIIATCKVKSKISRERIELDYVIPGYSLHPGNRVRINNNNSFFN